MRCRPPVFSRWLTLGLVLLLCVAWADAQTPRTKEGKKEAAPAGTAKSAVSVKNGKPAAVPNAATTAKTELAKPDSSRLDPAKDLVMMTPAREAAALTFAGRHHAELAELLAQLKNSNPGQYEKAMQELFRTSERLARIEEKLPDRYPMELKTWKLDSRIRLLAARLAMSDNPALEEELKAALLERVDLRIQANQQERDRLTVRLKKIGETLDDLQRTREEVALKEFTKLKHNLGGLNAKTKKPAKPADGSPAAQRTQPVKGNAK